MAALLVAAAGCSPPDPADPPACTGSSCDAELECMGGSCGQGGGTGLDVPCPCGETVSDPSLCPPPPYRLQWVDPPAQASGSFTLVLEVRPDHGGAPAPAEDIVLSIDLNGIEWSPAPELERLATQDGRWELRRDLAAFPGTPPAPDHEGILRAEARLLSFACVERAVTTVRVSMVP